MHKFKWRCTNMRKEMPNLDWFEERTQRCFNCEHREFCKIGKHVKTFLHTTSYEDDTSGRSDGSFYSLLQKSLSNELLNFVRLNADGRNIDKLIGFCEEFVKSLPVHSYNYIFGNQLKKIGYGQMSSSGVLQIVIEYSDEHAKIITLYNVDCRRKDFM